MRAVTRVFWSLLALVLLTAPTVRAQYRSTITFVNRSGEDAVVKLVGPSGRTVNVENAQDRTLTVAPGRYHIVVRYGSKPSNYSYSKGDPFLIQETETEYSEISITLHKVVNGNYHTRPARPEEFNSPGR